MEFFTFQKEIEVLDSLRPLLLLLAACGNGLGLENLDAVEKGCDYLLCDVSHALVLFGRDEGLWVGDLIRAMERGEHSCEGTDSCHPPDKQVSRFVPRNTSDIPTTFSTST